MLSYHPPPDMRKHPQYYSIVKSDNLERKSENDFPEKQRIFYFMSEYVANDFPRIEQRDSFSKEQEDSIRQIDDRRFQGLGGSSKSLAIAARSAVLAGEGKQILICLFNIRLIKYLRDLVDRCIINSKIIRKQVEYRNFHNWCERIYEDAGYADIYRQF